MAGRWRSTSVPTTTASTTTASTSTTESADLESNIESVLADRVRGYFDARASANAAPAPDPLSPGLAEYATGEELAAVVANTERRRDGGEAIRPGETALAEIRVAAGTVNRDSATVAACVIDDGVIFDVASGEVINDDVVTHNYQIELVLDGGVWKVARIVRVQQWEGVAGCALMIWIDGCACMRPPTITVRCRVCIWLLGWTGGASRI